LTPRGAQSLKPIGCRVPLYIHAITFIKKVIDLKPVAIRTACPAIGKNDDESSSEDDEDAADEHDDDDDANNNLPPDNAQENYVVHNSITIDTFGMLVKESLEL
jgi:hypothetical protein